MAADIENRDAELARLADTHGVDADRLLNVVVLTAVSEAAAAAARVDDHHMVDCEMTPLSAAVDHECGNDWLKQLTAAPPVLKWDVVAACRQFTAVI